MTTRVILTHIRKHSVTETSERIFWHSHILLSSAAYQISSIQPVESWHPFVQQVHSKNPIVLSTSAFETPVLHVKQASWPHLLQNKRLYAENTLYLCPGNRIEARIHVKKDSKPQVDDTPNYFWKIINYQPDIMALTKNRHMSDNTLQYQYMNVAWHICLGNTKLYTVSRSDNIWNYLMLCLYTNTWTKSSAFVH